MKKDDVKELFQSRFIHVYDLQYAEGKHYYDASRRAADNLAATKTEEEFRQMLPDAVSCFVILRTETEGDRLLLSYEYRYPAGHYLLSVPAGLIDPEDAALEEEGENPVLKAARREIHEETNLTIRDHDRLEVVNPLVFSTPGMTDESNALVLAVLHVDDLTVLSHKGAVGSEKFGQFALLSREDAERILKNGVDDEGHFYPLYTWAALMYFVSGRWKC